MNLRQKIAANRGKYQPLTDAERVAVRERLAEDVERNGRKCDPAHTWNPQMTEQQKQEQDEYIKLHGLPF